MEMAVADPSQEAVAAQAEVIDILRDLIRIDTTNDGTDTGPGEALAAEYVEASLAEAGLETERFTTTSSLSAQAQPVSPPPSRWPTSSRCWCWPRAS